MKKIKNIIILVVVVLMATSCSDKITEVFVGNSPIYMSYEDLAKSVKQTSAQELKNPGKIYFKGSNFNPYMPFNLRREV